MITDTHIGVVINTGIYNIEILILHNSKAYRYRQGSNRSQQRLQNDYNHEANVRPWHFNDYMRQNDEYNEII